MIVDKNELLVDIIDPNTADLNFGFIGLGAMGFGMAINLVKHVKGTVITYVRDDARALKAEQAGAQVVRSLSDFAARNLDLIFTCLPTTDVGLEVAAELIKSGQLKAGSIYVDFTSGVPEQAREIAAQLASVDVEYLDCALAGGPAAANAGNLSMMIGGKKATVTKLGAVLDIMSDPSKVIHVGPCGSGHAVKAVNNAILAANILSVGEGLAALSKQGIPMESALAAINTSSGRSLVSSKRVPDHVLSGKFDFGFSLELMKKDIGICISQLDEQGIDAPVLRQVDRIFGENLEVLGGSADHMEVLKTIEENAQATIRSSNKSSVSPDPIDNPKRVFNFSAGPACLPLNVLKNVQSELLNYENSGMSFMEMSHRDANGPVQNNIQGAADLLRELLKVPDNYQVLFFQGGAHGQFSGIPMNLAYENPKVDYIDMGVWSQKAITEARKTADVHVPYTVGDSILPPSEWNFRPDAAYVHVCMNETIAGIEILNDFDLGPDAPPVVVDATSTLLSRPIDISKYGVIYASAGKNFGPAGVCIVIVRDDLIQRQSHPHLPGILSFKEQANSKPIQSIYNTPPCFQIYMLRKILDDVVAQGGLDAMQTRAKTRADRIYDIIDQSNGFYCNSVDAAFRSRMNICFGIRSNMPEESEKLESAFTAQSEAAGMFQLFKHPAFGGLRITQYNALPDEAIDAVCQYMINFQKEHESTLQS